MTEPGRADLDGVFGALADPTRRRLYERLRTEGGEQHDDEGEDTR